MEVQRLSTSSKHTPSSSEEPAGSSLFLPLLLHTLSRKKKRHGVVTAFIAAP